MSAPTGAFDASRTAGKDAVDRMWLSIERWDRCLAASIAGTVILAIVAAILVLSEGVDLPIVGAITGVPAAPMPVCWLVLRSKQAALMRALQFLEAAETRAAMFILAHDGANDEVKKSAATALMDALLDRTLQPHETTRELEKEKISAYSQAGLLTRRRALLSRPEGRGPGEPPRLRQVGGKPDQGAPGV